MPRALFALLAALVAATVYFFSKMWLPALATNNPAIDHQITLNFILLGLVFCATQIALGLFVWKYRERDGHAIAYSGQPSAKTELTWLTIAAALFLGLNIAGALVWSDNVEMNKYSYQETVWVEVTGVQFRWYFRQPGKDGRFGETKPELIDASEGNPLGINSNDPTSADDIVSSELVIPAGKEVELTLFAQDVIHSFFVPALRIKQDAVPGQAIIIHIPPAKEGTYEIACAQLCGMGHYQMNAKLKVVPEAEYRAWLARHSQSVAHK